VGGRPARPGADRAMKSTATIGRPPGDAADGFGPGGAAQGPAAIVREMARDLLRQRRLAPAQAAPLGAALRDHDWSSVRAIFDVALRTTPPGGDGARAADDTDATADATADADAGAEATAALARVVLRMCDALPRLTTHDPGVGERLKPVRDLLNARLTPERIDEIDARVAAVLDQQIAFERGLQETRGSVEELLGLLLERLGSMGTSTERFAARVQEHRRALAAQPDPQALSQVVEDLLEDTRDVADTIAQSQAQLAQARRQVLSFEARVRELEQELAAAARLMQNDPLTQALNRRGLEDLLRVEMARATRYGAPLSLVMVDLDDFKAINDTLGHAGGDRALVHFVTTAQACLRSTERIARTGGEEFVIAFAATPVEDAADAVRRLQRALAASAFEHEGQSRVLSFSGGATAWLAGEALDQTLRRADAAMYAAKRAGKNRVVIAG